jgi:muconolactone D-isomerase
MQFLVKITSEVPPDYPQAERKRLVAEETAKVGKMRQDGKLIGVWKVPLTRQSVTAWEVQDAVELHVLLMSLPGMPWASATVLPLVQRNLLPH